MSSPDQYYEEFIRYYRLAETQQAACNLGMAPYAGSVDDPLMEAVELYDVVERRYAGFSQLIHDCFYGWTPEHPYWHKMEAGVYGIPISWEHPRKGAKYWGYADQVPRKTDWPLENWLYLFLVHRLTGSGINYSKRPSGYHNTVVPLFHSCDTIEEMSHTVMAASMHMPIFTSIGYQFPAFPKPPPGYKKGGVYFMREPTLLPELARKVASFLGNGGIYPPRNPKPTLRELGQFMFDWNASKGLRAYRFQYAAFIADVCDWFPDLVDRESPFYYGSNAVECISYLTGGRKAEKDLDAMMLKIYDEVGSLPYNAEDVCCDFIRWVENYVRPGADYDHLDRDAVFSSCTIKDHPFGRQKAMLDLGLIGSFNDLSVHPADDYVISRAGVTPEQYRSMVHGQA